MSCPICEKRKAARFCPAKGETICAVCCGTEREVTIDCPSDCSYLVAAHRYEGHQRSVPADTPLLDQKIPDDIVYTQQQLMAALAFSIAKFCTLQPATVDADVKSLYWFVDEAFVAVPCRTNAGCLALPRCHPDARGRAATAGRPKHGTGR